MDAVWNLQVCYVRKERGKVVQSERIELPDGGKIKSLEKEKGYKYFGMLQFDSVKSKEMKDMRTKEYYGKIRKILKVSINAENIMQAINARVVLLLSRELE